MIGFEPRSYSVCLRLGLWLLWVASAAWAGPPTPMALERVGSCPSGYHASGNYCVPGSNARFALPRHGGACPSGYHSSGGYCLASSDRSRAAVPRHGSCPSGYSSSGDFCLSTR